MHAYTQTHTDIRTYTYTRILVCMFKRSYNKLPKIFITYKHQPTFTPFFSLCMCIIFIEVLMSAGADPGGVMGVKRSPLQESY